jgi:hypothetical protein
MSFWNAVGEFASGMLDGAMSRPAASGIDRLCHELGWSVDEQVNGGIRLHFSDPVVGIRKVTVRHAENGVVTFRCISHAFRPCHDEPPMEVLGYLLHQNCKKAIGARGVSVADDSLAFVLDYTALEAGLDAPALKSICEELTQEVSAFDAKMKEAGLM